MFSGFVENKHFERTTKSKMLANIVSFTYMFLSELEGKFLDKFKQVNYSNLAQQHIPENTVYAGDKVNYVHVRAVATVGSEPIDRILFKRFEN